MDNTIKSKTKELEDTYTKKMADLDNTIASNNKILEEQSGKLKEVTFKSEFYRKGFKGDDFDRVKKLRSTYEDLDDEKALDAISNDFKSMFFPEVKPVVPNEPPINTGNPTVKKPEIKFGMTVRDIMKQ